MRSWFRRLFRREKRVHKRPLVTAITVFVVFLIAASILFLNLGLLRMSSDYPQVKAEIEQVGVTSSGLGVNLSYIPSTNLVWDPSFENRYQEEVFSVAEAGGNAIYLHGGNGEPVLESESVYRGSKIRIMSYDEEGQMRQVLMANVLDYQTRQMGIWKDVEHSSHLEIGSGKIYSNGEMALLIMQDGVILTDVTSLSPARLAPSNEESVFVDVAFSASRCFSVTNRGDFFFSSNGRTWNAVEMPVYQNVQVEAMTVLGNVGIACGPDGKILVCDMSTISEPKTSATCDFHTATTDGQHALLAGSNGEAYVTSNGTLYRKLNEEELPSGDVNWKLSFYQEEKFVLVGEQGEIAIGTYEETTGAFAFEFVNARLPEGNQPRQLTVFPGGEIWMLTDKGFVFAYSNKDAKWKQIFAEKDNQIDAMGLSTTEGVLILRNGKLYTAPMYTKVTIDQEIGSDEVQSGNICMLSVPIASVSQRASGLWDVFGENTSVQIVADAPKTAGEKALQISSSNAEPQMEHFVSQVISRDEINPMQEKTFYHMKVLLKQEKLESGEVMMWLSGLKEPIGTTFTNVNGNWKEYSYTFAWPSGKTIEGEDIRLNIGFYGSGEIYVDDVCLEREAFSSTQIDPQIVDVLDETSPEFIRLESLGLGRLSYEFSSNLLALRNEGTYIDGEGNPVQEGVVSLESTLRLVKQSEANPWFPIDSAFGSDEVEALLGYICGNMTDDYGKIRVDNGTAVPWSKQFERIIIETTDENGLFETDLQRRAYVDYIISQVTGSKFYSDIKDKLFFVDGMHYEDGIMTSSADYHSSSISINNNQTENLEVLQQEEIREMIASTYQDYVDEIPRDPSYILDDSGEWINHLSFSVVHHRVYENEILADETSLSAAEMIDLLLMDLGDHTTFVTVDLPVSRLDGDEDEDVFFANDDDSLANRRITSQNNETMLRLIGVLSKVAQGERITTNWVAPLSKTNDEDYSIDLRSYAYYHDGAIYLIIMNPTDEQQQFLIESDSRISDIDVTRYSATCEEIALASTGSILRMNERRYTLQAGQFCVAVIPV